MKKLFAMAAVALFSLAIVGCNDTKTGDEYTLSANKTEAAIGETIDFTFTGDLAGKSWTMCDFQSCYPVDFTSGKYTYTVPEPVDPKNEDFSYNFYAATADGSIKSNYVKIKIKVTPK